MAGSLRRRLMGLATVGLLVGAATPALAEMRAVVIGINAYAHLETLDGAVNDARDVADALRAIGTTDLQLLLDGAVTRDAVMKAWADMIGRSQPGDVVMLSYAGHGGQSPERVKGSEATGMDSELLLTGFTAEAPGNYERIVDDEINLLLKQATDAQLAVLLVVDACHSGTMTRGFDTRVPVRKVRAAAHGPIVDDRLPAPDPVAAALNPADLPNVLSLGAVQDEELAPEVMIGDQWRGALSWAAARGLRGAADTDHDGVITDTELQVFVRNSVRIVMDGQQHPSITKTRGIVDGAIRFGVQVLKDGVKAEAVEGVKNGLEFLYEHAKDYMNSKNNSNTEIKKSTIIANNSAEEKEKSNKNINKSKYVFKNAQKVKISIINLGSIAERELIAKINGDLVEIVSYNRSPELIWDVNNREILNKFGDVVAYADNHRDQGVPQTRGFGRFSPSAQSPTIPPAPNSQTTTLPTPGSTQSVAVGFSDLTWLMGVLDKWRLISALRDSAMINEISMSLTPGDRYYHDGEKPTLTISGMRHPYFALLDVAGDGSVVVLYPQKNGNIQDDVSIRTDRSFVIQLQVEPPYGADHFIAISSDSRLDRIIDELNVRTRHPASADLTMLLRQYLTGMPHNQIGLHSVYTAAWTQQTAAVPGKK